MNTAELDRRWTPLHIAVQGGKTAVIAKLLAMGVSCDAKDVKVLMGVKDHIPIVRFR